MGVGITCVIGCAEVPVGINAPEIGITGTSVTCAILVVQLRFQGIYVKALLQTAAMCADVAEPQRGVLHQFALDCKIPFIRLVAFPIANVPCHRRLSPRTDSLNCGGVHGRFADELIRRALARKYGSTDLKPLDDTLELAAASAARVRPR